MENEPENSQDARVESLWSSLDTEGAGHLDLAALREGLKKLDHRTGAQILKFYIPHS